MFFFLFFCVWDSSRQIRESGTLKQVRVPKRKRTWLVVLALHVIWACAFCVLFSIAQTYDLHIGAIGTHGSRHVQCHPPCCNDLCLDVQVMSKWYSDVVSDMATIICLQSYAYNQVSAGSSLKWWRPSCQPAVKVSYMRQPTLRKLPRYCWMRWLKKRTHNTPCPYHWSPKWWSWHRWDHSTEVFCQKRWNWHRWGNSLGFPSGY